MANYSRLCPFPSGEGSTGKIPKQNTMTKKQFITIYREKVSALPWAIDSEKLERFMQSAFDTIENKANSWNFNGPSSVAAWREIGGKGKLTLKALRALA
jgi:hypothetical protein